MVVQLTLPFAIKTNAMTDDFARAHPDSDVGQAQAKRRAEFGEDIAAQEQKLGDYLAQGYIVVSSHIIEMPTYSAVHYVLFKGAFTGMLVK